MGSVIDYIDCPHCGEEAYNDFYYKSGEEYTNCIHCGYQHSVTIKNRDKNLDELTDDDWEVKESPNPFGVCKIKTKDNLGHSVISLKDENQLNELKLEIEELINNGIEIIGFCLSRFIEGEIKVEYFIGTEDNFN